MNQAQKQIKPVALVTGAARRIGAEIAKMLHHSGFNVAIHCHHSLSEANHLAERLNQQRRNSALVVQYDMVRPDAADYIMNAVLQWNPFVNVLVNNASLFNRSDLKSVDYDAQQAVYSVNVLTPLALSIKARPYLAESQGVIINITDIHGVKPLKGYLEYCQTKAALQLQTKALAREFAPDIRVNAVAPGAIAWPEGDNQLSEQAKASVIQKTLLKKHGDPVFIAQSVLDLVHHPFITGQVLNVDGGRSIS